MLLDLESNATSTSAAATSKSFQQQLTDCIKYSSLLILEPTEDCRLNL